MDWTQHFMEKAKARPARIVFPEGTDERIVETAVKAKQAGIAEPVIVGTPVEVESIASAKGLSLEGIPVVSPLEEEKINRYADLYARKRDMKVTIARKLVRKPLSFGAMMVSSGDAQGMVAGVASATASVIQSASLAIGFQEGLSTPSSFFIMIIPQLFDEKQKPIIFADCAVNISPSARQLAEIAIASGTNAKALLGFEPRIAFLSFATKGSASHADVDKVVEATRIAQQMGSGFEIDGELQGDSAIAPHVAAKKVKEGTVAGQANVLVFPDLDAGNICYKLVQYLAGAKAIGPVLQGFAKPVNDMSRGATVEDLLAVTAITSLQAEDASKGGIE